MPQVEKETNPLFRFREENDIERIELADRLGVSYITVYYWEVGRRTPGLQNMRKIADVMGMHTEKLMDKWENWKQAV